MGGVNSRASAIQMEWFRLDPASSTGLGEALERPVSAVNSEGSRVRALFEHVSLALGVVEARLNDIFVHSANQAAAQCFGVPIESLQGRTFRQLGLPAARISAWLENCRQCAQLGGPVRFEYGLTLAGEPRTLAATVIPIESASAEPGYFGFMIEDVTRLHQVEAELRSQYEFTQQVIGLLPMGLTVTNAAGRFVYVNQAYGHLLGRDADELIGSSPFDFTTADEHLTLAEARRDRVLGRTTGYDIRLRRVDGSTVDTRIIGAPRFEGDGLVGDVSLVTDLTERHRLEAALRASERRFRDMVELSQGFICAHDLEGRLLSVNPAAAKALGYAPNELVGVHLSDLLPPDARAKFPEYLERLGQRSQFTGVVRLQTRGGAIRLWKFHNVRYDDPGDATYIIGHAYDITDRQQREAQRRNLVESDPLTGLPKRDHFEARLRRELRQAPADDRRLAVLHIDLDGFKQINDELGQPTGDQVLRQIADRLRVSVRGRDLVARFDGDEFLVLAVGVDRENCARMAKRLESRLQDPIRLADRGPRHAIAVSASIGIALGPDHALTADGLLTRADEAMHHAKRFRLGIAFADE